ncbi:MAG: hypothetical protein JWP14_2057 [Frankiales bacterium]|nr:hypothetical protein [Frankiales bacterium]
MLLVVALVAGCTHAPSHSAGHAASASAPTTSTSAAAAERRGSLLSFIWGSVGSQPTPDGAMYRNRVLALPSWGDSCPDVPKTIVASDQTHLTVNYVAANRRGGCFELLTGYTALIQLPSLIDISRSLTVEQTLPEAPLKARQRARVVAAADLAEQPPSTFPCRPDIQDHRLQRRFSYDHGSRFDPTNAPMTTTVHQALAAYRNIELRRRQPVTGHEQAFWARYSDGGTIRDKLAWVIWTPAALRRDSYSIVQTGVDNVVVLHDATLHAIGFLEGRSSYC